ncbi:hypothetical protein I4U23_027434 [Adineta vaga]|nr:hypothetical protein I4U23_027434 [Adineta vaga]
MCNQISKDDSDDPLYVRKLLKQFHENCLFYNDLKLFIDDINNNIIFKNKENTLLIISGLFTNDILNNNLIRKKISSIIIFCNDNNKYLKYSKSTYVIDICIDYNSLKNTIQRVLLPLKHELDEDRQFNTIRFLKTKSFYNTNAVYSYMLFVEILKEVPQTNQAKDYMLNKIISWNRYEPNELEKIERFRIDYTPDKAIQWYTEDSFIYKLINRAFRTEDVSMWYLFRFYIKDLCKQIEQVHQEQNIKQCLILYRGQSRLPKQEFENICSNIGGLISTNGFLSSSKLFDLAYSFIADCQDEENSRVVMFEITVDAKNLENIIFVDISQHLPRSGEGEILFNIGTIFKIDSVEQEKEFWRIKIHATDEGSREIQQKMDLMKNKFEKTNLNLLFGRLLIDMGLFDKAQSYFNLILQVLPDQHQDLPLIYDYLGDLQMRITNYNRAFEYFQLSLKFKRKNSLNICITYNHLGNYYKSIENFSKAIYYYNKTLKYETNLFNIGIIKLNLSLIYLMIKQFSKAEFICLEARNIFHEIESFSYGEILLCQGILGDILFQQNHFKQAQSFYHVAFDMAKKYLSIGDSRFINCINALANFYQKQNNIDYSLKFLIIITPTKTTTEFKSKIETSTIPSIVPPSCLIPTTNAEWNRKSNVFVNVPARCLSNENALCKSEDLFIDNIHDNLYVVHTKNNRIQKYSLTEPYDPYLGAIGITVASKDLIQPQSIFVDSQTEDMLSCSFMEKNDQTGRILFNEIAEYGSDRNYESYLTLDKEMNIYVGTRFHIRKWLFSSNYTERVLIAGMSETEGSELSDLWDPYGFYVDNDLTLYIMDSGNKRIQKWLFDATEGITLVNSLTYVYGLTIGCNGHIYYADFYDHSIFQLNLKNNEKKMIIGDEYRIPGSQFYFIFKMNDPFDAPLIVPVDNSSVVVHPNLNQRNGQHRNLTKEQIIVHVSYILIIVVLFIFVTIIILLNVENKKSPDDYRKHERITIQPIFTRKVSTDKTPIDSSCPIPTTNADWNQESTVFVNVPARCLAPNPHALCGISDLFIDNIHDNLYLVDMYNHRIQKYSLTEPYDPYLGAIGIIVASKDLIKPQSIFVDSQTEDMYILDHKTKITKRSFDSGYRVHLWKKNDQTGRILFNEIAEYGSDRNYESYLTLDKEMNIYVGTRFHIRKWLFSSNYSQQVIVAGKSEEDIYGPSGLYLPNDFYVDNDLTLYIMDSGNKRIQKWLFNATEGITLVNNLTNAHGLTMGCNGHIYYADFYDHSIFQLNLKNNEKKMIIGDEYRIPGSQVFNPMFMKFDKFGNIFAFDVIFSIVKKFSLLKY